MADQTELVNESLYDRAVRLGINLDWYHKSKRTSPAKIAPLSDQKCSRLSIYMLRQDGSLWTVTLISETAEPYTKVRDTNKKMPKDILICVHCKKQFNNAAEASKHEG